MDFIVILFSLVLLQFKQIFQDTARLLVTIISLVPFWIVIIKNILFILSKGQNTKLWLKTTKLNHNLIILFFTFILLLFVSLLRGVLTETVTIVEFFNLFIYLVTVLSFGFALFLVPRSQKEDLQLRKGILYAICIYVVFNVLLELAGVSSSERASATYEVEIYGKAKILELFGIDRNRVFFPMGSSINSFANVAGASLVIGVVLNSLVTKRFHTFTAATISLASLYALVVTDCRSPLFYSVVAIWLIKFTPIKIIKKSPLLAIFSPLLPFLSAAYGAIVLSAGFSDSLSRSADDLQQLGGRVLIWEQVLSELSNPSFKHLIGYGIYGQAASGISNAYANVGSYLANPERMSVHNFFMQYILDLGYLGALLFIILLFVTIKQLVYLSFSSNYKNTCKIMLVVLLYLILSSSNEVALTIYNQEAFTIFLFIVISNLSHVIKTKQPYTGVDPVSYELPKSQFF